MKEIMLDKKLFVDELCEEGQRLWDAVEYHFLDSYDDYKIQCKKCQDGLELREKDLLRVRDDIKGGNIKWE